MSKLSDLLKPTVKVVATIVSDVFTYDGKEFIGVMSPEIVLQNMTENGYEEEITCNMRVDYSQFLDRDPPKNIDVITYKGTRYRIRNAEKGNTGFLLSLRKV